MNITPFVHEGLGNSSYLVPLRDGTAAVIDPDRSVGRYIAAADALGLTITHVFESHLHADFVSGACELAATAGATVFAAKGAEARFAHRPLDHGDAVDVGGSRFETLASVGHTPEHLAYVLRQENSVPVLFSGGSLIVGGAGRTDLLTPELTGPLTRAQFRTLQGAYSKLPDETLLMPTHGGGSFCSTGSGSERTSTLGWERKTNPLLVMRDEEEFVRWFPTTFPAAPDYFFKLRPINQRGPRLRAEVGVPPQLEPADFARAAGQAVVVDVRPQAEFMAGHVPGALSNTFRDAFATWLGWLVPLDTPLLFVLGEEPLERVLDESLLVGHERFVGVLRGGMGAWNAAGLQVATAGLVDAEGAREILLAGAIALDVREPDEFASGHIEGAISIPLGSLAAKLGTLSRDSPIVTNCGHGERSATALSILQRAGFDQLHNLDGGIDAWQEAGYRVVS